MLDDEEIELTDEDLISLAADLKVEAGHLLREQLYSQALQKLNSCERMLTMLKERGVKVKFKMVVDVLRDLAFCYEQTKLLVEAAAYLEACVYNYEQRLLTSVYPSTFDGLTQSISLRTAFSKASIQLLALHSRLGRHTAALKTAKVAVTEICRSLEESQAVCKSITRQGRQARSALASLSEKASNVYKFLLETLQLSKPSKAPQLSTRSALGVQIYNHWVYSFNIGDLTKLTPAASREFSLEEEFGVDGLYRTILLIVCLIFCIGMELKYKYDQEDIGALLKEGRAWMKKSQTIAQAFLPDESPLLEHLASSYGQMYGELMETTGNSLHGSLSNSRNQSPTLSNRLDMSIASKSLKSKLKGRSTSRQSKRNPRATTPERKPIRRTDYVIREIEKIVNDSYLAPESSRPSKGQLRFNSSSRPKNPREQPEPTPPAELQEDDLVVTSFTEDDTQLTSQDLYGT